jgi:hypothetical protein
MTDLGALLASADLALLGKNVWLLIGARMDMRSACRFAQTCRAGRALLQVDKHNEVRFRREKSPVSMVIGVGHNWLQRFCLAQPFESLVDALDEANYMDTPDDSGDSDDVDAGEKVEDSDASDDADAREKPKGKMEAVATIILCPGVYVIPERNKSLLGGGVGLLVREPVHIVGCCFDQNYDCMKPSIRHVEEVPCFGPPIPNIRIVCRWSSTIMWRASHGSIRDVSIALEVQEDLEFEPAALWLQGAELTVTNCSITSNVHSGVALGAESKLIARACRFHNCKVAGLSFVSGETGISASLDGCWLDGNDLWGMEVSSGDATFTNCAVFGNRFNGLGIGDGAKVAIRRCNIFGHALNGVDVMHGTTTMTECNVEHNWCGVRQVVFPDEAIMVLSDCNVSENVHAQHSVVRMTEEDEVAKADAAGVCTFLVTETHFMLHNQVYRCRTCASDGSFTMCHACRDSCHAGHKIEDCADTEKMPMLFFCDCALTPACAFADRIAHDVVGRRMRAQQ